jgi:hypothetical protein
MPVFDRVTEQVRGARADDVAVLVATNAAERVAGPPTRCCPWGDRAPAGLLSTPEDTLTTPALRSVLESVARFRSLKIEAPAPEV